MNAPGEPLVPNPLLDFSGLPRFGEITPEHVAPGVDTLLADARATVERVAAGGETPAWESFVLPLAAAQDRLDRAWGQVAHLNAVVNTPALREAYNASLPKVTSFHTEFAQDAVRACSIRSRRSLVISRRPWPGTGRRGLRSLPTTKCRRCSTSSGMACSSVAH